MSGKDQLKKKDVKKILMLLLLLLLTFIFSKNFVFFLRKKRLARDLSFVTKICSDLYSVSCSSCVCREWISKSFVMLSSNIIYRLNDNKQRIDERGVVLKSTEAHTTIHSQLKCAEIKNNKYKSILFKSCFYKCMFVMYKCWDCVNVSPLSFDQ